MGRVTIDIKELGVLRYDTTTFTNTDAIILNVLPSYAAMGGSQINNLVTITDATGNSLFEVMDGDAGALTSIGGFSFPSTNQIKILVAKGTYANVAEALVGISNYIITFTVASTATYIPSAYRVRMFDRLDENKFFDSIILGDEQLLNLMKANISTANLRRMNPFRIEILPEIRVLKS